VLDPRGVRAGEGDPEIEPIGEQIRLDRILGRLPEGEADPRMFGTEPVNQRADQIGGEGRRRRHPQMTA